MTAQPPRPLGIEYATLDLRRASAPSTEAFIAEVRRELDTQMAMLIAAEPSSIFVAQGAVQALLRLHEAMSQAAERVEKYEAGQRKAQENKR